MWWIPLAMDAASMINEKQKENQLDRYNQGQAEVTRYSPWTGIKGQIQPNQGPGMFGAGIGGAVGGLGLMQAFGGGGGKGSDGAKTKWTANDYSPRPMSNPYNFGGSRSYA